MTTSGNQRRITTVWSLLFLMAILNLASPSAFLAQQAPVLNPTQQKLVNRLEHRLMAPCCYSQVIADHQSQESIDMRQEVEQFVASGKSEAEIVDYYRARYGKTILVVPDGLAGVIAYTIPVLLALGGVGVVWLYLNWRRLRRKSEVREMPATASVSFLSRIRTETSV